MPPPLGAEKDREGEELEGRKLVPVRLFVPRLPVELEPNVPVEIFLPVSRIKFMKPLSLLKLLPVPEETRRAASEE